VVYTDPYLSDRVEKLEGPDFARLIPAPITPDRIADATLVAVSHIHPDHCDPDTLLPLLRASPSARVIGPRQVINLLADLGLDRTRLIPAQEEWLDVGRHLRIRAVPAAHKNIEREADSSLRFVGFVIEIGGRRIYHAGDTCVHDLVLAALASVAPVDVMLLPVNECNFFRDRLGIVGNMSVRDAFSLAATSGCMMVVPMHYDMFRLNCVYREEIEAVYRNLQPPFQLVFDPEFF
jgi:L-ascorbate metabolism protein UlaG (beta-lactamase superfamily)